MVRSRCPRGRTPPRAASAIAGLRCGTSQSGSPTRALNNARTAARELGRFGIRVNVVAPGLIDTAMTRSLPEKVRRQAVEETVLGRAGRPEDVAHAVLYLCTEMSAHVSGQVLRVDGGQLMA